MHSESSVMVLSDGRIPGGSQSDDTEQREACRACGVRKWEAGCPGATTRVRPEALAERYEGGISLGHQP